MSDHDDLIRSEMLRGEQWRELQAELKSIKQRLLEGSAERPSSSLEPKERVEEAHGLWELAVVRATAIAECICVSQRGESETGTLKALLQVAVDAERAAFVNWQRVSKECGA